MQLGNLLINLAVRLSKFCLPDIKLVSTCLISRRQRFSRLCCGNLETISSVLLSSVLSPTLSFIPY